MKKRSWLYILASVSVLAMSGCGTAPVKPTEDMPQFVSDKPVDVVQRAALDAMATIGCDIVKKEPNYVECNRPHKIGLFVGSGGETVSIYLQAQDQGKTLVHVNTAKSFVGIVGQKDWSDQLIDEMKKNLQAAP